MLDVCVCGSTGSDTCCKSACVRLRVVTSAGCVRVQVWIKPHPTLPTDATLWGILGYAENSEAVTALVEKYRERQLEAREIQEQREIKKVEGAQAAAAARDSRVANLEQWLSEGRCKNFKVSPPFLCCHVVYYYLVHCHWVIILVHLLLGESFVRLTLYMTNSGSTIYQRIWDSECLFATRGRGVP